jgi:hypothetical protein
MSGTGGVTSKYGDTQKRYVTGKMFASLFVSISVEKDLRFSVFLAMLPVSLEPFLTMPASQAPSRCLPDGMPRDR